MPAAATIILSRRGRREGARPDHAKFEAGEWRICIAPGHADRTPSLDLTNDAATGHLLACCRTQCGARYPHLFDRLVHLGLVPPPFGSSRCGGWRGPFQAAPGLGGRALLRRSEPADAELTGRSLPSVLRQRRQAHQQQLPAIIYLLRSAGDEPVAVSRVFLNGHGARTASRVAVPTKGTAFRLSREVARPCTSAKAPRTPSRCRRTACRLCGQPVARRR